MSDFIKQIAPLIQKYAPQYGIKVYSPIIAQAILESAMGTSELAVNAHNYFGLKYKPNVSAGFYIKVGSEQNVDGSYTSSVMKWCKFKDMEQGVKGYFDFISAPRYAALKGVTEPKKYLIRIKAAGYATSLKYVDNLMAVIQKYNLTQYDGANDNKSGATEHKMKINIHAGHNPDGKAASGAVGFIKESTEARAVKDMVIAMLRAQGYTVTDCTVDDGINQQDILKKIVAKCNAAEADLNVSIHFNAGGGQGTEVYVYSTASGANKYATRIGNAIASLGFRNRGLKVNPSLYVLRHTKAPAMLIECCFVDSLSDIKLYDRESMAKAITEGLTGQKAAMMVMHMAAAQSDMSQGKIYRVQCGAFKDRANAELQVVKLKSAGFNAIIV